MSSLLLLLMLLLMCACVVEEAAVVVVVAVGIGTVFSHLSSLGISVLCCIGMPVPTSSAARAR